VKKLLVTLAAVVTLAGCGPTAADLPLPGSSLRGSSYEIKAEFNDALNLAVGAPVKVDGVTVGRVRSVKAHDFSARVTLDVRTSTHLHSGAKASLRSTTPLGELFIQLTDGQSSAPIRSGTTLAAADTSAAPTIEDTMTAASMLINGGGLGQLQTIVREANAALGGHEKSTREVLARLASTAKSFNASSDDIDAAIDAIAKVSTVLNKRQDTVNAALTDIAPAAKVLRTNTDELANLLRSVDDLGTTTTRVVAETRTNLLSTLHELSPVLDQFVELTPEFGPGLDDLVSFAGLIDRGVPGDYLNTYLHFQDSLTLGLPAATGLGGLPPITTPPLKLPTSGPEAAVGSPPADVGLAGLLSRLAGGR
jgi:phospholipid/cholesterol/gamma-HCH transport system substrate-binding protein